MAARWPDEVALWTAVAMAGQELRHEEAKDLARKIRNEIAELF